MKGTEPTPLPTHIIYVIIELTPGLILFNYYEAVNLTQTEQDLNRVKD